MEIPANVLDNRFPPNRQLRWPERRVARICVVLAGAFTEHLEQSATFTRGDVVFRPPEARGRIEFGPDGMRSLTLELLPDTLETLKQSRLLPQHSVSARSPKCLALGDRIAQEMRGGDLLSRLIVKGLVLELVGEFRRDTRKPRLRRPAWLTRVHAAISGEFASPRSLAGYGRLAGVHPAHLARSFRAHYGLSIGEYIRECRVHHAAKMILVGRSEFAEIALESGFSDHSHMTNSFRRRIGMTPSEYRQATTKCEFHPRLHR